MSEFNPEECDLMARAVDAALQRLKVLGLVDGDEGKACDALAKLVLNAASAGERNEENLVLYAIGRFHPGGSASDRTGR